MTDELGQRALMEKSHELADLLMKCEALLEHGDIHYWQHSLFAGRAASLGLYLRSAISLADQHAYPQAFAMLRSSLEHQVFDRLLFLADRYELLTDPVDDETWKRWEASRPPDLIEWTRRPNGRVRALWSGVRVDGSDGEEPGQILSAYYKWLQDYDPFVATDRERMALGYPPDEEESRYVSVEREIWQTALAWQHLKANLKLNDLMVSRSIAQLDVHYRFLSAFVHPVSERALDLAYPRNTFGERPLFDHYSEELTLLYACFIAADELRAFHSMSTRPPRVALRGWQAIHKAVGETERLIAHGWFPGRPPFSYDRVAESNQRAFDSMQERMNAGRPYERPNVQLPDSLTDDAVRYYTNPLRRLVDLHMGFHEITTGLGWSSPWSRSDARSR